MSAVRWSWLCWRGQSATLQAKLPWTEHCSCTAQSRWRLWIRERRSMPPRSFSVTVQCPSRCRRRRPRRSLEATMTDRWLPADSTGWTQWPECASRSQSALVVWLRGLTPTSLLRRPSSSSRWPTDEHWSTELQLHRQSQLTQSGNRRRALTTTTSAAQASSSRCRTSLRRMRTRRTVCSAQSWRLRRLADLSTCHRAFISTCKTLIKLNSYTCNTDYDSCEIHKNEPCCPA